MDVRKSYPGVIALQGFSMTVRPGEVIGLVGENGAGKSTLMKILGGVVEPDSGTITVDGVEHRSLTVASSMAAGIAFVHQELNLFDNLDVAANIFIGREPRKGGLLRLVDTQKQRDMAAPLLARLGAGFKPSTPLANLSLAQRQMVEIAKALSMRARLVILDEPTSSLPLSETAKLLDVVAALKADGISVILISHRLHEIEEAADRVIVLRDGARVGTLEKGEIHHDRMVKLMIGRDLKAQTAAPAQARGPVALQASAERSRWTASPMPRARRRRRWPAACSSCRRTARLPASFSTCRSRRTSRCPTCRSTRTISSSRSATSLRSPRPSAATSTFARRR
jgi:ribose transport system ATP-binding protein